MQQIFIFDQVVQEIWDQIIWAEDPQKRSKWYALDV